MLYLRTTMAISAADANNDTKGEQVAFWLFLALYSGITCASILLKLCFLSDDCRRKIPHCKCWSNRTQTSQAPTSVQKDECNQSCKYYSERRKRSAWSTVKRHLLDTALDFATVLMGILYLVGDNLPMDTYGNP